MFDIQFDIPWIYLKQREIIPFRVTLIYMAKKKKTKNRIKRKKEKEIRIEKFQFLLPVKSRNFSVNLYVLYVYVQYIAYSTMAKDSIR